MGIHGKFFEEPRERSQHTINGQFLMLMADVLPQADKAVYERIFAMRDTIQLIPVEAKDKPFDWDADVEWEGPDYPPEAPIGWDSA